MQKNLILFVLTLLCCLGSGGCGTAADTSFDHSSGHSGNPSAFWGGLAFLFFVLLPSIGILVAAWLQKRNKRIAEAISKYPLLVTAIHVVRRLLGPACVGYTEHPVIRWIVMPFVFLIWFWLSGFFSGILSGLKDNDTAFCVFIFPTLWFVQVLGFICLSRWYRYGRYALLWLYWRNGTVVGPFSKKQLVHFFRSKQIAPDTPIRQVKDPEWCAGVLLDEAPRRLQRGLFFGVLGLFIGFPLCFELFGHAKGRSLTMNQLFRELDPVEVGYLHGLTKQQMINAGVIRVAAAVGEYVPNPFEGNASRFGKALDEGFDVMTKRVERAQNRTLGFTALIALLAAAGGAALAPVPTQLIKERRIEVGG